jgi:hypothetical protein
MQFQLTAQVKLGNAEMVNAVDALGAISAVLEHALDADQPPQTHVQPLRDVNGNSVGQIEWSVSQ